MRKRRLIYLPGIDGTGRLLFRQTRLFTDYQVHCIDYPQDRCASYDELAQLGESHLGDEGGLVLAESFGGAVALTLALSRPDLVHRLVLVNTFAWFPRQPLIKLLAFLGRFLPMRPSPPWVKGLRGSLFFGPGAPATDRQAWWERTADVPLSAYGMRTALIARLDLRDRLVTIDVPTLVFVSPNDRVVPPTAGRLLAKRLPHAQLIERPAGHAALIHPGVDIANLLAEFEEVGAIADAVRCREPYTLPQ